MKAKKSKKYICIALVLTVLLSLCSVLPASADAPYPNYYISDNTAVFSTPSAYEVMDVLDFPDYEHGKLANPSDLFIGPDGKIYISDTGNNRIAVFTKDLKFDFEITGNDDDGSRLNQPMCAFVDESGTILVADYGNKRLIEFTKYGNFKYAYPTPSSDLLVEDFNYQPYKVAKDDKGYIYVCSVADSNGILMLSSDGQFRNYFGTNDVSLSIWETIARVLWSRESRYGTVVTLPYTFNNIFISHDGYVYATTTGSSAAQLRKINAAGKDVLYAGRDFTDTGILSNSTSLQTFVDVSVDKDNNMFIMDSMYGRVYEYDADGRLLFSFGSNGVGYGQFSNPASLDVDTDGHLYVLNKNNSTINVFKPTDFANLVHKANKNYFKGIYTEEEAIMNGMDKDDNALALWSKVLDEDSFYRLALQSKGRVKWREEQYQEAYSYYYDAEDAVLASEAFEEIREEYLKNNFSIIASVLMGIIVILLVISFLFKRYRKTHPANPNTKNPLILTGRFFKKIGHVAIHPIDGFEDIRYEGKGFISDAIIIMIIYVITHCLSLVCTSFIYRNGEPLEFINWGLELLICLLPWLVITIVNYGVTTILYGEGRYRDVFIGGAYCHVPMIFLQLPLAIISNVLTLNEQSLYNLGIYITYAWVVILVFFCMKGVHGFNPLKAVLVFILTILAVAAVVVLALVVYGLAEQFIDFVVQFVKELSYLV